MVIILIIYGLILIGIGIYDYFHVNSFKDYIAAGKKRSFFPVYMSLMATMIGASVTIGMIDKVQTIGICGIWWFIVAGIGLFLQSKLLSQKIWDLDAMTLADVAEKVIGKQGRLLIASIIVLAWTGIIAAQFLALTKLLAFILQCEVSNKLLIMVAYFIIGYIIIGGQISVVRSDTINCVIIFIGFIITFFYLYLLQDNFSKIFQDIPEKSFTTLDFIYQFFIVGSTYFLGPDVLSRNLISKNAKTAKNVAFWSSITFFLFGTIIVSIGLWGKTFLTPQANMLIYMLEHSFPIVLSALLSFALLATILSSVDTCLINMSSIFVHDILGSKKIIHLRISVAIFGTISLCIAIFQQDIISLLINTYSCYSPGIVCPLFIAIVCHKKYDIHKKIWLFSIFIGSVLGFASVYLHQPILALIGMALSAIFGIASFYNRPKLS